MYHSYLDVLLSFWKVRHALSLNILKPQVCIEYSLIHSLPIFQDIPTQSPQKVHSLLLSLSDGLKE